MTSEDFKRKLTAIFSADVAGNSRFMGEDEAQTVKTLTAYREVMSSLITQNTVGGWWIPLDITCWLSSAAWWMRFTFFN